MNVAPGGSGCGTACSQSAPSATPLPKRLSYKPHVYVHVPTWHDTAHKIDKSPAGKLQTQFGNENQKVGKVRKRKISRLQISQMLLKNNVREAGHVQLFLTVTPIVQLCVCAHSYCHKYTHQTLIYGDDVHLPTTSYLITLLEGGQCQKVGGVQRRSSQPGLPIL